MSVTLLGYLVLGAMVIVFQTIPREYIAYGSGIVMTILGGMVLLSVTMLVTGWGSKLAWFPLLVLFGALAWQTPVDTASQVVATGTQVVNEGVQSVAPNLAPIVPNFVYMSPEEKADARRAEAEGRRIAAEEEKQRVINEAVAQAAAEAEAAKYRPLTAEAFTTRTAGEFEPIQIKSGTRVGPINMYAACNTRWTKTGFGMIKILTRDDFTSAPVEAVLTDRGYGIKETGHGGLPTQMFFEATHGDIQIEMIRFDNGTNKDNPCK
jgi:hypothetical protein